MHKMPRTYPRESPLINILFTNVYKSQIADKSPFELLQMVGISI